MKNLGMHEIGARSQLRSPWPTFDESWRGILDIVPAIAYTCDADGLISYFSPFSETVWGRAPKLRDPSDRYCGSLRLYKPGGGPMRHDQCWMALALRDGHEYNGREVVLERPDGMRVLGLAHANPLHGDKGQTIGAVNLILGMKVFGDALYGNGGVVLRETLPSDAVLAMIEIVISTLTALTWSASAFA